MAAHPKAKAGRVAAPIWPGLAPTVWGIQQRRFTGAA
jgi:hypothetical protein